jgi:ubiquinone/menaquinone biosynthesis C-methylase UbiE
MNAYYQTIASEYARHRRVHPEVLRCLISTGKLGSASSLLEVGCGTGNYLVALDEVIGCDCWGVDPSEAMLAEARKRSTKAKLFCVPAEHMGLPADQFDLVFAVDVVHHIVDRSRAFRECRRVLRAGGRLCLVTESPSMIRRREPHATYFPEAVPIELARYPSLLTLTTELHEAGFIDLTEVEVEFPSELADLESYRAKVHSSLHLIPQDAFDRGIKRLEQDFRSGPVPSIWRYVLLWTTNPSESRSVG